MPAPAATVGDLTSHQSPLGPGPGSPTVLIGGRPAWRVLADSHACPLSEGPKPHLGGKVLNGSLTVYINGFPAARMGDKVTEAGPPNVITSGYSKVIIG
jgi:uncharacterized Zn-binding protein involved in type VI secretion